LAKHRIKSARHADLLVHPTAHVTHNLSQTNGLLRCCVNRGSSGGIVIDTDSAVSSGQIAAFC